MKNNPELINILKAELTLLTKDILQRIHKNDINDLYKTTRKLYEKMLVIKHLSEQLSQDEILELVGNREQITEKKEKKEEKNIEMPEQKKASQDDDFHKKDTISKVYKDVSKIKFVEKSGENEKQVENKELVKPKKSSKFKNMSIGLNDRIAFINNLFDKDADAYTLHINRINGFDTYEEALQYIQQELKPKYHNWEGKDEYEFRLLQLLELKFS